MNQNFYESFMLSSAVFFYFSWVSHLSCNCQMTNHSGAAANKVIITLNVWCHHKSSPGIDQPLIKTKAGTLGSWKCQTLPAEYTVHLSMSSAGTLQWEWVDGDVYECKERRETWSVGVRWKQKGRGEKRENEGVMLYNMLPVCKGNGSGVPYWGFIISKISHSNPFQHPPLPPLISQQPQQSPRRPPPSVCSTRRLTAKESFAVLGWGFEGKRQHFVLEEGRLWSL